jgi:hypothetical protein
MPKFPVCIAVLAIALASCQPTPTPSPTPFAKLVNAGKKAADYLRSQMQIPSGVLIVWESEKLQSANINDLCQTTAPTEAGFEFGLVAADVRYIVQTNQDATKIEICRSEDAQPATMTKYTGAGYQLRYPNDWKAIDLGLEPSGASTVIFTPSREINLGEDKNDLVKTLQQKQQVYTVVSRQPSDQAIASDDKINDKVRNIIEIPFDPKVKGAKSGSKKEFTQEFTQELASIWNVRVLTLETDKFIYTVSYYRPNSQKDSNIPNSKLSIFDQFANSFALIP